MERIWREEKGVGMESIQEKWELFSHKADMGIRGMGSTFERAFEQAGLALTGVLMDPTQIKSKIHVRLSCSAPQIDILFYDWINEIIYEMARNYLVFGRYQVTIASEKTGQLILLGEAWGESINLQKQEVAVEIKGATFTELKVETNENGECFVQCVVDV